MPIRFLFLGALLLIGVGTVLARETALGRSVVSAEPSPAADVAPAPVADRTVSGVADRSTASTPNSTPSPARPVAAAPAATPGPRATPRAATATHAATAGPRATATPTPAASNASKAPGPNGSAAASNASGPNGSAAASNPSGPNGSAASGGGATPRESVPAANGASASTSSTSSPGGSATTSGSGGAATQGSAGSVALTFDAGADRGYAEDILDTLAEHHAVASFGVTGVWAKANPDLVRRMAADGHLVINHTLDHRSFTGVSDKLGGLTVARRRTELQEADAILAPLIGHSTKPFYRLPYGDDDAGVAAEVSADGYTRKVGWTVDSLGWRGSSSADILARCLKLAAPGGVYVFHVGKASQDALALPSLIGSLRERGYGLVRVDAV